MACLLSHAAKAISAETEPTRFPLARLNIHHGGVVLLCEVFEQDHVVLFVGVVDEHRLGAHTQHLTQTSTEESQPSSKKKGQGARHMTPYISMHVFYIPLGSPPAPTE